MDLASATEEGNNNIEIAKTLEPGAHGLDPETLYI
jgi:hypothetical protein